MTSKVFLLDQHGWFYCSNVSLKDEVYTGWVENGAWYFVYDTKTCVVESYQSEQEKRLGWKPVVSASSDLTWMCYPQGIGYNEVIENAKNRYKAGEEANYSLEPIKNPKTDEYDDAVAFL